MQSIYNLQQRDGTPPIDLRALVGLLNSRLIEFVVFKGTTAYKLLFPQLNQTTLESLPLPRLTSDDADSLSRAVSDVEQQARRLEATKSPHEREGLRATLRGAQRNLDRLDYEAYDLAAGEVELIERAHLPAT